MIEGRRRGVVAALVAIGVAFSATPVRAGAGDALGQARKAFLNMEYERVIPLLRRALRKPRLDAERGEIHGMMAQTHAAFGRSQKARASFVRAIEVDPDYRPQELGSPKVIRAFESAQQEVLGSSRADMGAEVTTSEGRAENGDFSPMGAPGVSLTARSEGRPLYKNHWLWVGVGGAAAVIITGLAVGLSRPDGRPDHQFSMSLR